MGDKTKRPPVVELKAEAGSVDWGAPFCSAERSYRFAILHRQARPAWQENHVWHIKRSLDVGIMQEGANFLLGTHDFTSDRAIACQAKSAVRTLDVLKIHREGDLVLVDTQARSFLHHQVRNMVGSLVMVGSRQWPTEKMRDILEAKNRCAAGPTSPPDGLCLTGVGYPEDPFA